jgi:hypothetical protein
LRIPDKTLIQLETSALTFARQLLVPLLCLIIASCGGDGDRDDPIQPPPHLADDASLSALTISGATLDPEFSSSVTEYTTRVSYGRTNVVVDGTASDENASVMINGGTTTNVALAVGENSIAVLVTAEDGTTTRTYTVVVTRAAASDNAYLSGLELPGATIDPVFSSSVTDYATRVFSGITSVDVNAATSDDNASVTINGGVQTNVVLTVGENTIIICRRPGPIVCSGSFRLRSGRPILRFLPCCPGCG